MSVDGGMAASGSLKLPISTETSEETELKHCFAYLLIFFGGLPERASEFTSAIPLRTVSIFEVSRISCTVSASGTISAAQRACSVNAG